MERLIKGAALTGLLLLIMTTAKAQDFSKYESEQKATDEYVIDNVYHKSTAGHECQKIAKKERVKHPKKDKKEITSSSIVLGDDHHEEFMKEMHISEDDVTHKEDIQNQIADFNKTYLNGRKLNPKEKDFRGEYDPNYNKSTSIDLSKLSEEDISVAGE